MTFETLGLSDSLLRAVAHTGYTTPTPIQTQAIPAILSGDDVMAAAQTGTGKTYTFNTILLKACAEWKELTELVCEHMQHGPCGRDDPKAACSRLVSFRALRGERRSA